MLQHENLKRELQYVKIEENSMTQSVKIEKEENKALREQILTAKNTENSLIEDNKSLKKIIEKEKESYREKIKLAEEDLKNLQDDYELSIQELKQENEKLKSICGMQNASIADYDKKIRELEHMNKLSEEARDALKKQQEAAKYFIKDVVSVNEQLVDTLKKEPKKTPPLPKKNDKSPLPTKLKSSSSASNLKTTTEEKPSRKRVLVPSYLNQEGKLQEQIQSLENEIYEINSKYKKMLRNSEEGADYIQMKADLDSMAKALDEKSRILFNAKRRYSNMIREKIMNFDN